VDRTWHTTAFGKGPHPAVGSRSAFLTYETYYGLTDKPFSISDEPKELYKSPSHALTLDELLLGIRRREGLIVLTGDIGTGKTTLCKAALSQLDRKTFSTFVPDPFMSREDLLKMLLIDFGVMSVDDLKSGRLNGASRPDLSYPLYEFLRSLVPLDALAVLIVDEAQNLSIPVLEELRILSDLAAPEKLLQVVLVGQLELRAKLKLPEMRQLDQRVSVRCNLEPLNAEGVTGYVTHRLNIAHATTDRVEIPPDAIGKIADASGGVPRLINLICDRALYRGYLARTARIDLQIVSLAIADLGVGALTPYQTTELDPPPAASPAPVQSSLLIDSTSELADLDVHELHEFPHVEPLQTKQDASSSPEADPAVLREMAIAETIAPWRWRRRIHGFAKVAAMAMGVFIVLFSAELGWMTFGPDSERPQTVLAPAAPLKSETFVLVPPAPPDLPPLDAPTPIGTKAATSVVDANTPRYTIDVALFSSPERAAQLVSRLGAAGFPAYATEIPMGATSGHVVLTGDYGTPDEAQGDLARIQGIAGYADARIISAPRKSAR
jgi:type II secretory pathway predicted ATPase ExeA